MRIEVHPVGPERWGDLTALFGRGGAYSGCWCMFPRISSREFDANGNAGNRAAMRDLVHGDERPGLLGYADGSPVAWCALNPRPAYARLLRSTTLTLSESADSPIWSVPCFFIRRDHRRGGLAGRMLDAAVDQAGAQGAAVLEGYPVDSDRGRRPPEMYSGTIGLFERSGFAIHLRPDKGHRVVMRRQL